MKPPFTSSQEMYNYAANQLMNQNLSPEAVKNNLMKRGVTDADAETVVQNMLVTINKQTSADSSAQKDRSSTHYGQFATLQEMYDFAADQLIVEKLSQPTVKHNLVAKGISDSEADTVIANMMVQIEKKKGTETNTSTANTNTASSSTGNFTSVQEMYNYAADQLIVKKLSQQTTKMNLMKQGLRSADADVVIQNMMEQIQKNKPAEGNPKRAEGKRMMLVGLIVGGVGALLLGKDFTVADQSFSFGYGILIVGGLLFLRGLFKMF